MNVSNCVIHPTPPHPHPAFLHTIKGRTNGLTPLLMHGGAFDGKRVDGAKEAR